MGVATITTVTAQCHLSENMPLLRHLDVEVGVLLKNKYDSIIRSKNIDSVVIQAFSELHFGRRLICSLLLCTRSMAHYAAIVTKCPVSTYGSHLNLSEVHKMHFQ